MAVTGYWYPKAFTKMGSATGYFDWVADSASMKIALMNTAFTGANQSLSAAAVWSDVSAYEASGTSYTGVASNAGKTIGTTSLAAGSTSNKTVTYSSNAASTVWSVATISTCGAVVLKHAAATSNSPVIFFLDFGGTQSPSAGDFTITWNAAGFATVVTA